jgi:hypothetical protein
LFDMVILSFSVALGATLATAKAFLVPTITTSFRPRVMPMYIKFLCRKP